MTFDLFGSGRGGWVSGMAYCYFMKKHRGKVTGEAAEGFDVTGARDRLWGRG